MTTDMADQYTEMFSSTFTSTRIRQLAEFGINLINNETFKYQMYEHAASIFALMEQKSPNLLCHFPSLMSLGKVTESLARQHHWDMDYINRVRQLYRLEEHDAQVWVTPINKYLSRRNDYRGAGDLIKIMLNDVIRPDQRFDLTKVNIPNMDNQLELSQEDFKMIAISTDILNIHGTIFQLERTFSTSTQICDDEQLSTVEEVGHKYDSR